MGESRLFRLAADEEEDEEQPSEEGEQEDGLKKKGRIRQQAGGSETDGEAEAVIEGMYNLLPHPPSLASRR